MVGGRQVSSARDERFAHIPTDPRFKPVKRSQQRIKADTRWRSMLKDERFTFKATAVDKRGRPRHTSMKEDLQRIYDISDSSASDDDDDDDGDDDKDVETESESGESKVSDDNDEEAEQKLSNKKKNQGPDVDTELDIARGQGLEESSDEEDSDEDDEDKEIVDNDDGVEHPWGEMDKDAKQTTETTSRLAVCNMDWDRVRAVDLLVLFNSFKPETGVIKSVTIYPSEYGLQRLKEEDKCGPLELAEMPAGGNDDHDADDDGAEFHREKLRQYELNRLRYYYGVVECDSAETANSIYEKCDGIEYENSASRVDLRFIPEDMTFDQKPKSSASSLPMASDYQPPSFTSSALQSSSVKLTWDETPHERVTFMARNFSKDEIADQDLAAFLASDTDSDEDQYGEGEVIDNSEWKRSRTVGSDEESEDEDAATLKKFKSLVQDLQFEKPSKRDKEFEMEVTWEPGLKEKAEKKVKDKEEKNKKLSPWEEYREKKKKKRLEKKEARISKKTSQDEETANLREGKGKKNKKQKKKLLEQKKAAKACSSMTDTRFSAVYSNPRFSVDQSAPEFKQSQMMDAILTEKVKRRTKD